MAQGTSFNVEEEFAGLDLHSLRLEERFIRTMETLIWQPDKSIWEASEDRAEAITGCWGMKVLTGRRSLGSVHATRNQ
jgi:hypothetical protein